MKLSTQRSTPQNRPANGIEAPKASDTTLAAFIWKNADDLWGDFKHTDFGKIILPFTLLRRLECVLEPTRDAVRAMHEKIRDKGIDVGVVLRQTAGLPFYNTSQYSLASLGATKTKSNLEAYIAGFSGNARVIFEQFNFTDTIARLARADNLFKICQNFASTDLHPDVVPEGWEITASRSHRSTTKTILNCSGLNAGPGQIAARYGGRRDVRNGRRR